MALLKYRMNRLKYEVPTRWHSRMSSRLTYITKIDNIAVVALELDFSSYDLPHMNSEQRNTLAEIIHVLAEVRNVAQQI